jgi:alanine racemase
MPSAPKISIDLPRVRRNAEAIIRQTGVPIIAVVKADAYGLGAGAVAEVIGDLVEAFYVFDAAEAVAANLWDITGKRTIALNSDWNDPAEFLARHIQPVVWTEPRAATLRRAKPALSIDTGQQRFAVDPSQAAAVRSAGDCREVMTHATRLPQVNALLEVIREWDRSGLFVHAAGSALLDQPSAWLDAVRPGLALYRGAVRVTASLIDVRDSNGPAGYTGFTVPRFGVIMAGYSNGLRKGPCKINGQLRRVIEVGMQSAFVEAGKNDQIGDEVILLAGEAGIDETAVAQAWNTSPQEVLYRLSRLGR